MRKISLYFLTISLMGCGLNSVPLKTTPPADAQSIFLDPSVNPDAGIDVFQIKDAQQIGDYVVMDVSYSGGCAEHVFRLESRGDFTATYPPELNVTLKHDNNGDRCRGVIDNKLWFDLRPAQFDGTNRILLIITNTETTLEYNY